MKQHDRMRVCITGGIACGKSLVGGFLAGLGVPVLDADDVCRELTAPGSELHRMIVMTFGREIVRPNGEIDRRALAALVLACPRKREKLNALIHPEARKVLDAWPSSAIIPLVYEAGWEGSWDSIICVSAPVSLQIRRLIDRGLSEKEAVAWINAQMPLSEKMRRADYVIFNSGTTECARIQTLEVFSALNCRRCDKKTRNRDGNLKHG